MRSIFARVTLASVTLGLVAPTSLWAHSGHAGDHGWLAGAAQPLLSLDHFLAGLFVAVVVGVGIGAVAGRGQRQGVGPRSEPRH